MQNRKLLPFIMPLVLLALVAGVWAGWIRIGWAYPLTVVAGKHGALMVGSFLGTLISLERAVVIKNRWAMLTPFLSGVSFAFFLLNENIWAFYALTLGSLGQVIMMGYFLNRYKMFYMNVMLAGSICWFTGNLMWLVWDFYTHAVLALKAIPAKIIDSRPSYFYVGHHYPFSRQWPLYGRGRAYSDGSLAVAL